MTGKDVERDQLVDAVLSGVLHADDEELAKDAAAVGEDLAGAAASLRARFLERAAARARETDRTLAETVAGEASDSPDGDCPRSIGRYPILRRLGSGGMGVVYAAYDELLDRRLALKVLHEHVWDSDGRRRERLLREAQAMARVTHPNVVTVHEVGTAGEQLFVAMEFVAGPTLKEWLALERRGWREIVEVFRQIADGLAALHEAGLVHRDVKPTNVLIGDDGRVRVLDLGLVVTGDEPVGDTTERTLDSSSSLNRIDGGLTKTGERVGTPAYMSREQFLGLELTPASDIFSFCVALFEALYRVHPFMAATFYELQANVVATRIATPPSASGVPAWLHAIVVAGLAADPKDRPASMRALSVELGKDPSRTRRRWIGTTVTAALASLIAVAAVSVTRSPAVAPPPTCDGGAAAIASVWTDAREVSIRSAMLATELPYASALAERVSAALDDYANEWATTHDASCRAHARGDHSAALLDARMACLDRRRQSLSETVAILADADAEVVERAGEMVGNLPRIAACNDIAGLLAHEDVVAPADVPVVAELESRLVRAEALAHAGRFAEATAITRAVADEAERREQPRLIVHALLAEARASILRSDRSATRELLDAALSLAVARGLDKDAAEAMIRRLYVRGLATGGSEAALADLPFAEAMLVRSGDDPELRALLLNNEGAIRAAAGQREAARDAFARSLAIKQRLFGDQHLELAVSLANLGMLTDEPATRGQLHERMIAIYERWLGPDHPQTLDARLLAAFHTSDPEASSAAFARLCPRFRANAEPGYLAECELERGRIEVARGRLDVAREAFTSARAGLDGDDRLALVDAYLALGSDDPAPAIAGLRELLGGDEGDSDDVDWWVRLDRGERRVLLGRLLAESGDAAASVAELERAIVDLEAIADEAQPIERERLLAQARAAEAAALLAGASHDEARIDALREAARAYYLRWPSAYAEPLASLDALDGIPTPIDRQRDLEPKP